MISTGLAYMRRFRIGRYELVRFLHANMLDELYDVVNDPGEEHNFRATAAPASSRLSGSSAASLPPG